MEPWQTLVDAYDLEDRLLRELVSSVPRPLRETPPAGGLSCKMVLAHLAFWDDFTVRFFECKVNPGSCARPAPGDFEAEDRLAIEAMALMPFGEILARYLEATGALRDFLKTRWDRLTPQQRRNFWVPLQHRRDHRFALARALAEVGGEAAQHSMATGA